MEIYKKLIKNSWIFAIANLGSKLITILLVPFYTYVLNTSQYGTVDIMITSISLLLPLINLSIFEGTLRFSIKSEYDSKNILSTSIIVILVSNFIFILMYPLLTNIPIIKEYVNIFYLILFIQGINLVFSQFLRGIGRINTFAFNGIIITVFTVILNIIFLVKFNMGVIGYMLSILLANIISSIFMIFSEKIWIYINFKKYNGKLLHEMLSYSIPLIPNSLMWWIMNLSDRYAITIFLGVSANGLYAVANKIPSLLNLLNSIFFQAWQLSAIEECEDENKSHFYSNVFNAFSIIMLISTSIIILFIKPLVKFFISNEFSESWKYTPFLLLGIVFSSFSGFLGTNYIAMKKTKGIFKSSLIGAIINIILNVVLISMIGLNGAAIATMISFFIVWIIRIYDTREFVKIKIDVKKFCINILFIFIQILVLYLDFTFNILIQILLLFIILLLNVKEIKLFLDKIIVINKK
ncbi:polysaccharide biosynthesis protein [Clostridium botulinum]|uniref:lipopolysaccharide biosynthesis protein n=1 Tax=Clostridium botulinum TaxID=1491 RepID=UPI0019683C3B|nr:polysaccharide biosynthesis C-terminal domain-containing protein [Clostridium botulinum]MBN1072557.1 polysaccharide biosynthesis protein [Clostridium botulinum]